MYVYVCVCAHARSVVQLCLTICDPRTVPCQAPLFMELSRQEYWSSLSSPGNLPNPETEPSSFGSPAWADRFFTNVPPGKPKFLCCCC